MNKKRPIIILESSLNFKKGKILSDYQDLKEGVVVGKEKHFIPKAHYIKLNENLSPADEKRVKELIKSSLKFLFWNWYTKANYMIGN